MGILDSILNEGNWLNGQKNGYGLYYSEEEIYEGEWQRG